MTDLKELQLGDKFNLLKSLPDLEAGAIGELITEDSTGRRFILIPPKDPNEPARDGWFFFLDEIIDFDSWFKKI